MPRPSSIPTRIRQLIYRFRDRPGFVSNVIEIGPKVRETAQLRPSLLTGAQRQRIHRAWRRWCGP